MFSSSYAKVVAALAISAWLVSCGLNTNERPHKPEAPTFSGKSYGCIGEIPAHFERYFQDQMGEPEINEFVRCLQKSVTSFVQLTRGRDESTYAPAELRRFIQNFFLKDRPVSDTLLKQFMIAKRALIGGEVDQISRAELFTAVDILEDLRKELIRLKPHLTLLNPNLAGSQPPENLISRLSAARAALGQTIVTFNARLQKNPRLYLFDDLKEFLVESRAYVGWEGHFADTSPVASWIRMLRSFKLAVVNPEVQEGITGEDWNPLLHALTNWYLAYVQYRVGVKSQSVFEGFGLQNLIYLVKDLFTLTEDAISHQPTRTLTYDTQIDVLGAAQELGWISPKIRLEGLRSSLKGIIAQIYGDEHVPTTEWDKNKGLTEFALDQMRTDFSRWALMQSKLDRVYRAPERQRPDESSLADWEDFLRIKSKMKRPLFPEDQNLVYLVYTRQFEQYGMTNKFSNLSAMNLLRSLVSAVFRGYAKDGGATDGFETGMRSAELQKFYRDFRETGIDLGLLDKRKLDAGTQAFLEANQFTYSANGLGLESVDDRGNPITPSFFHWGLDYVYGHHSMTHNKLDRELTFVEAMEYFAFLYSGGRLANLMNDDLVATCPLGPLDQYDKPMFDRACAVRELPGLIARHAVNMPGLQAYLAHADPQTVETFAADIVGTVYSKFSTAEWLEYAELTSISGMLHYLEAVMTRYDVNADGKLSTREINEAAKVFAGSIQTLQWETEKTVVSRATALGAFRFIVFHRALPRETGLGYKQDRAEIMMRWLNARSLPAFSVDRGDLARIFRLIISRFSDSKEEAVKAKSPATEHH